MADDHKMTKATRRTSIKATKALSDAVKGKAGPGGRLVI